MPEVIKPGRVVRSEEVVIIPDIVIPRLQTEEDERTEQEKEADLAAELEREREREREAIQQMARQMLEAAGAERDEILRQAQNHCAVVLEEARAEGYEAGRKAAESKIKALLTETRTVIDELQKRQNDFLTGYQNELAGLSLDIAQKVIGSIVKEHEAALLDLVRQAVMTVKSADWITIELSGKLGGLIEQLSQELTGRYPNKHIQVIPGEIPEDGCVITTPSGSIDASVTAQLGSLRELFEDIDSL